MPVPAGGASTLPDWAPTLSEVADYCTARTLVPQPDGSNREESGFNSSTRPTDAQVTRIVQDACNEVLTRCGALAPSFTAAANRVSAQLAAGYVELRYPERSSGTRDEAIKTAQELLKRADRALEQLAGANEAATGVDTEDPAAQVLPVWSFPAAYDVPGYAYGNHDPYPCY
jgi:hypothetical protein